MGTARAKYQTTAPGDDSHEMAMKNPRRHCYGKDSKPSGKSGKGTVSSKRPSTYRDGYRG
jgi:hypothetical protein